MPLSKAQTSAVTHKEGPALVLAGPGSGKTTVITHRVKYLTEECGVAPIHILVVTFTKAAAKQMKERFLSLCRADHTQVRFGTFHSVFYEILKHAYRLSAANIAGENARYRILKEAAGAFVSALAKEDAFLQSLAQGISIVKNERIPPECYDAANLPGELFRQIFWEYQRRMAKARLLDYDDLMTAAWELLNERQDILEGWRARFRYILVDEFQDINRLQYDIIKLLASPANNLFAVGDDDQSIYRFRGAKPEMMLHFAEEYPDAFRVSLDINYRCPGHVIAAAGRLIEKNTVRFPKAVAGIKGDKEAVEKVIFQNPLQESLGVIRRIIRRIREGGRYRDIAVLYRSNSDAFVLSQKLLEYNIPFFARDHLPNLFEHWIAQQIKAYLRFAAGGRARSDFLKIMNCPQRHIARAFLDSEEIDLDRLRMRQSGEYRAEEQLDRLKRDLNALARLCPYEAVNYIRHTIGYEAYLKEYAGRRHIRAEDLLEVLERLSQSAAGYQTHAQWLAFMERYTQMQKEQARAQKPLEDAVTLATLHGAKGLEFPQVFLIDVNEGTIPSKRAVLQSEIEEERRMLYVGMTRASEKLTICVLKEKYGKSLKPSPFLSGIF